MKDKWINFRVTEEERKFILGEAKRQYRTISGLVLYLMLKHKEQKKVKREG